jgi:hydroxymethylpyrimidine pyrophosphatase-like HAD family hydrolase
MGNAADGIKQRATHVTDSNEHDGFARAMETVLQLGQDGPSVSSPRKG